MKGRPLREIQDLLGHKSIRMTERTVRPPGPGTTPGRGDVPGFSQHILSTRARWAGTGRC